jgi:hypothetical protein
LVFRFGFRAVANVDYETNSFAGQLILMDADPAGDVMEPQPAEISLFLILKGEPSAVPGKPEWTMQLETG